MPGRVEGKVCLITGAARGLGRAFAIRLAEEGADVIAVDLGRGIGTVRYDLGTDDDMAQTVAAVEAEGRRVVALQADVRDFAGLKAAVDEGVAELGGLDIVCANAGIFSSASLEELEETAWNDMLAVNLTGVWHTIKAAIPHLRARGGGSIVVTGSTGGLRPAPLVGHYVTTKHGVIGLARNAALELAEDNIRVNVVHPTTVDTDLIQNPATYAMAAGDLDEAERTRDEIARRFTPMQALAVPWIEPRDVANAVLYLASDEARYVTGAELRVDAGQVIKHA